MCWGGGITFNGALLIVSMIYEIFTTLGFHYFNLLNLQVIIRDCDFVSLLRFGSLWRLYRCSNRGSQQCLGVTTTNRSKRIAANFACKIYQGNSHCKNISQLEKKLSWTQSSLPIFPHIPPHWSNGIDRQSVCLHSSIIYCTHSRYASRRDLVICHITLSCLWLWCHQIECRMRHDISKASHCFWTTDSIDSLYESHLLTFNRHPALGLEKK